VTDEPDWLPLPEVARRIGVPTARVREMLRDRSLLAVRRGEEGEWRVPAAFLVDGEDGAEPLPWLRGTVTVLADAGFDDGEAMTWLLEPNDELGVAPIDALRAGRRAHVRRIAQTLG
jgi:hypothetical protein